MSDTKPRKRGIPKPTGKSYPSVDAMLTDLAGPVIKKPKRIKAVRMYQYPPRGEVYHSRHIHQRLAGEKLHAKLRGKPVSVIDASNPDALVKQMLVAFEPSIEMKRPDYYAGMEFCMRRALKSVNLIP